MSSDRSDSTDRTTPFDTPSRSSFDPASRDSRHSDPSLPNTSPDSRRSADGSSSDRRHATDRRRPRHAPGVRPSGDRRPPATRQTRREQTGNDPRTPRERRPWLHADNETDPTRPGVTAERLRWLVRTATVVALLAGGLAVLIGLLAAVGTPLVTVGDAPLGPTAGDAPLDSTADDALLDSTGGDSNGLVGRVTVGGTLLAVIAVGGVVLLAVRRPQ